MTPRKIAHVVSVYPPYRGGLGQVAFEYVERLRARGHRAHVFTPRRGEGQEPDPPYVHRLPSFFQTAAAGVVPSLFRRFAGFDVIHLHYPFFGGAEPMMIRRLLSDRQPLVLTYHMDLLVDGWKGMVYDLHRRVLFPWMMQRADRIFVSSKAYGESSALKNVPDVFSRVETLPFGVDLSRFHPGKDECSRDRLGLDENTPVMLFLGGLDRAHYFKGLSVLLEALQGLQDFPWYLVVAGEGEMRSSFEELAVQSLGGARVSFVGAVSEEEKPSLFRAADLFVFPSIDRSEAFGLAALEAVASGLPVVASALPGVMDIVAEPENGLTPPPGNVEALRGALRRLLIDPGLRLAMGQAGRARAERLFAWDPLMDRLEAVYEELLQKKSSQSIQV